MIHLYLKNAPPSVKPEVLGAHWLDRTSKRRWESVGTSLLTDWREVGTSVGGGGGGAAVFPPYDTLEDLKNAPATDFSQLAMYNVLGTFERWDGGMATYAYDQTSTATPNDNSVVAPVNVPGRLHKFMG
jgi:hypothetical protein